MAATRTPAPYLSHGAPPLAEDPRWTRELADWPGAPTRPKAILMVSEHWEDTPLTTVGNVSLTYDFRGFPQRYYAVVRPTPGAPALAERVRSFAAGPITNSNKDTQRHQNSLMA